MPGIISIAAFINRCYGRIRNMTDQPEPKKTATEQKHPEFKIGVNYWPQRKATRMWRDFDSGELCEDLDRLKEWKLSPIRILLRREDFQPEKDHINTKTLHRLAALADMCADRGLTLWVVLFTGHAHRVNWLPHWMVTGALHANACMTLVEGVPVPAAPKWPRSEPVLMQAQDRLIEEVLAVLNRHPALWAYDLGERLSSLYENIPTDQWRAWIEETVQRIRNFDAHTPITLGLQPGDIFNPQGLDPRAASPWTDFLSLSWHPRETPWAEAFPDPMAGWFLTELLRVLTDEKPIWISAFGLASTNDKPQTGRGSGQKHFLTNPDDRAEHPLPQARVEEFTRRTLESLRRSGLPGALWWCYADYPQLCNRVPFDLLPLEARHGLVAEDWRPKRVLAGIEAVERTIIPTKADRGWMDIDPRDFRKSPLRYIKRLYERFRERTPRV